VEIYMDYYCAAVEDESNPDLTMLERLNKAMNKIPTHGNEVQKLELGWQDQLPRKEGDTERRKPNPKNKSIIREFQEKSIKDDSATDLASYRQQILEGEDIDKLELCRTFKLMLARMHLQIKMIAKAKTTLMLQ
jgi:hypothetical protein